jgi:putative ubiquitin-RnfH superfamily antitoxin RatB of RatAB toxin-antitoxin module
MEQNKLLKVEVVYASPESQKMLTLEVPEKSTVETVIDRSGIIELFPEIDLTQQKVGIFSKVCQLTDIVKEGDRIEIYRPLLIDPKEARRNRARKVGKK